MLVFKKLYSFFKACCAPGHSAYKILFTVHLRTPALPQQCMFSLSVYTPISMILLLNEKEIMEIIVSPQREQTCTAMAMYALMDKLKLTGQNLGSVFNSKLCRACIGHAIVHITKQPNLKFKTWPKQLLGSLPLAFALPDTLDCLTWV